jgi:uncharacterized protein YjbI with pentapeptide repeats
VDSSVVSYDEGQRVRNEERDVATDPPQPPEPAEESEEQSSGVQLWLIVLTVLVLGGVVEVIIYGYLARPGWIGVSGKQFWDYLDLLIVPAALAIGVYFLNRAQERERQAQEAYREREREAEAEQREREREATEEARRERELEAQAAQRERELEVENRRAQDAAVQAYLDQMSQLLTDKDRPLYRAQSGDNLSAVARARTLAVLTRLNGYRKGIVLRFLYEAGLIHKRGPVLRLNVADLREVNLRGANLSEVDLSGAEVLRSKVAYGTTFSNISRVHLSRADLTATNLTGANLRLVALNDASLFFADLGGADLEEANLRGANLGGANLSGADLSGANLSGANLEKATLESDFTLDIQGASGVAMEKLNEQAYSLQGATMPNGQKYEDWLTSKDRAEDG